MKQSKFLDHVREVIRTHHFSYNTEKIYINWIYRFIIYQNKKHPSEMGGKEVAGYLTHLAVARKVSASTQNQALNALVFLYKKVLKVPLDDFDFTPSRVGKRLPVVLSRDEVRMILSNLSGEYHLMVSILYGCGLRLSECLNLRVADIDFSLNEIIIRGGKGDNDRRTILPGVIVPQLIRQIENVRLRLEENMLLKDFTGASMPPVEKLFTESSKAGRQTVPDYKERFVSYFPAFICYPSS